VHGQADVRVLGELIVRGRGRGGDDRHTGERERAREDGRESRHATLSHASSAGLKGLRYD
jgi:hypothetical protein